MAALDRAMAENGELIGDIVRDQAADAHLRGDIGLLKCVGGRRRQSFFSESVRRNSLLLPKAANCMRLRLLPVRSQVF